MTPNQVSKKGDSPQDSANLKKTFELIPMETLEPTTFDIIPLCPKEDFKPKKGVVE